MHKQNLQKLYRKKLDIKKHLNFFYLAADQVFSLDFVVLPIIYRNLIYQLKHLSTHITGNRHDIN